MPTVFTTLSHFWASRFTSLRELDWAQRARLHALFGDRIADRGLRHHGGNLLREAVHRRHRRAARR